MRQKTTAIATVALVVLVVGTGVTAAIGMTDGEASTGAPEQQSAHASGHGNSRSISVSASGSAAASPNRVQIQVAVRTTHEKATVARQTLAANVSQMRAALKEIGISDEQIRTSEYDLEWDEDRFAYRAVHRFTITVSDLDNAGRVIETAVANGADRVEDIRFTLTPEKRRSLRTQALRNAMANARSQAETLANASNLRITGVHTVQTSQEFDRPEFRVTASAMDGGDASTDLKRGPVGVQVRVHVVYNATSS